jgi:hypothetical protein
VTSCAFYKPINSKPHILETPKNYLFDEDWCAYERKSAMLNGGTSPFAGSDADAFLKGRDENFTVTHITLAIGPG